MTQPLLATRRGLLAAVPAAAVLTAGPLRALAPPALPAMLEPSAIAHDLAILEAAYGALHPGLDRYLGRAAFAERIGEARRWGERARSPGALFVALARLTAAVRCGHTHPNPFNQSDAIQQTLLSGRDRVPFAFRWIGGRMIVTRGAGLAPGTEIEAIDGLAARQLLARLLPLARADGANDGKRVALMEIGEGEQWNAFDLYRPLIGPARSDGSIVLRIAGRNHQVAALGEDDRAARAAGHKDQAGWTFALGADRIGLLTMPNWALYNSKWDWRGLLDSVADRLIDERAHGLVIDLRDNEGGLDCGDHLLARLIERPLVKPFARRLVRYRRAPDGLRPYLDTWNPAFRDWGEVARPSDRPGFFQLERGPDDRPGAAIEPRGRRFAGPVAVLISPTCSSATYAFANLVKSAGVARLVGRTSGGNRRGINGGGYFFLRLPATGLEVDLPLIGYFPDGPQPDAGVEPDLAVPLTRADLAAGHDRALAVARGLVG